MVTLNREVTIEMAHRLMYHRGKCSRIHGHSWKVEVSIRGEPDPKTGILVDFGEISDLINRYDHQLLLNKDDQFLVVWKEGLGKRAEYALSSMGVSDVGIIPMPFEPTSENLAKFFVEMIRNEIIPKHDNPVKEVSVTVWETTKCSAEAFGR